MKPRAGRRRRGGRDGDGRAGSRRATAPHGCRLPPMTLWPTTGSDANGGKACSPPTSRSASSAPRSWRWKCWPPRPASTTLTRTASPRRAPRPAGEAPIGRPCAGWPGIRRRRRQRRRSSRAECHGATLHRGPVAGMRGCVDIKRGGGSVDVRPLRPICGWSFSLTHRALFVCFPGPLSHTPTHTHTRTHRSPGRSFESSPDWRGGTPQRRSRISMVDIDREINAIMDSP